MGLKDKVDRCLKTILLSNLSKIYFKLYLPQHKISYIGIYDRKWLTIRGLFRLILFISQFWGKRNRFRGKMVKVVILYFPIVHLCLKVFFDIFKNGVIFDYVIVIYTENYLTKWNKKKKSVREAPFYLIMDFFFGN